MRVYIISLLLFFSLIMCGDCLGEEHLNFLEQEHLQERLNHIVKSSKLSQKVDNWLVLKAHPALEKPMNIVLDLPTCIAIAERYNPQLQISDSRRRYAEADMRQARSLLNFRVDVTGSYTYIDPTVQIVMPSTPPKASFQKLNGNVDTDFHQQNRQTPSTMNYQTINITVRDNFYSGIALTKTISTFGRLENRVYAADFFAKSRTADFLHTVNKLRFLVKQQYYIVLTQEALVRTARENLKLTSEQLEYTKQLKKEGIVPGLDVKQANLRNIRAKQSLINQENRYRQELCSLLSLLGIDSTRKDITIAPISLEPMLILKADDEEIFIKEAYQNRKDIKAAILMVEAYRKQLASAYSENNPQMNTLVKYEARTPNSFQWDHQWTAGLSVAVPVFDGGSLKANIDKAKENLLQSEKSLEQLKLDVKLEVIKSLLDYINALTQLESTRNEVENSTENYRIVELRYKNGIANRVELESALNDLINAKISNVCAVYNVYMAVARIEYNIGK